MNEQPEALRLADALETADAYSSPMDGTLRVKITPSTLDSAAAELRRQHDRITTLETALRQAVEALEVYGLCNEASRFIPNDEAHHDKTKN